MALQSLYSGASAKQAGAIIEQMKTTKEKLYQRAGLQVFQQVDQIRQSLCSPKRFYSHSLVLDYKISSSDERILLEILKPVPGASSDHTHTPCLSGTRTIVIKNICDWALDTSLNKMFWLNGLPGVGKSSIACSVLKELRTLDNSTAESFFCQRGNMLYNNAKVVIQTLIYNLACDVPAFRDCLLLKLRDARGQNYLEYTHYSEELRDIVCSSLKETASQGAAVMLVDALDECLDDREQKNLLRELLLLTKQCGWLKVILTSRPYQHIEKFFTSQKQSIHSLSISYNMTPGDELNAFEDLLKYTEHCIDLLVQENDFTHPGKDKIMQLAEKAKGLFQWVTVAVKYLSDALDQDKALVVLLDQSSDTNAMKGLYQLYQVILNECLDLENVENVKICSAILGGLIVLKVPLPPADISKLIPECSEGAIVMLCSKLHSVIGQLGDGSISIAHQSFADYLISAPDHNLVPSGLHFDLPRTNYNVACQCLNIMLYGLKFNICGLETSLKFNKDIPDLKEKLCRCVPKHLLYSCINWIDHYENLQNSCWQDYSTMCEKIQELVVTGTVLFWIEILSLAGQMKIARKTSSLKSLTEVKDLIKDVEQFVRAFYFPILQSMPQLYISAIPFSPTQSVFYKFRSKFKHILQIVEGQNDSWFERHSIFTIKQQEKVHSVAFSPDGSRIAGSFDKTITLWDAETVEQIGQPFSGHSDTVLSVVFSQDGSIIASGSVDKTVRLWDAETGEEIGQPLSGHSGSVWSVMISPDGLRIVSGSDDRTVRVWNAQSGEQIGEPLSGHSSTVWSVAFSPDGSTIVSGSDDRTVRLWDALTREQIGESLTGHSDTVYSVAFSPDGSKIVSGSFDRSIRLWDTKTREQICQPSAGHSDTVYSVAFSPDGSNIVSGSVDRTVRLWDTVTGEQIGQPLSGHSDAIWSVVFSPDGSKVVSGSDDRTVRMWDVLSEEQTGQPIFGHSDAVHSVAFSPEGSRIASGSRDKTVILWDSVTGEQIGWPLSGHSDAVYYVAFSPNGSKLVSGSYDRTVRLWDIVTGVQIGQPLSGHFGTVWSVAFSPDISRIASGSEDGTIRLWDAGNGVQIGEPLLGHSGTVSSVAFSPDGLRIVSGSDDGTVRLWDAMTGKQIREPFFGHTDAIYSVAFSPNGSRIVSGSYDRTIRLWDAEIGKQIGQPLTEHFDAVYSVAFSPDGSRIVSGADDRAIRLWDAKSRNQIGVPLTGHSDTVWTVAFSPDGKRIASGSNDGTVRLWDVHGHHDHVVEGSLQERCSHVEDNGWVYLDNEQRIPLLWIPEDFHDNLRSHALMCFSGDRRHRVVKLDFSDFAYGDEWMTVFYH